jgi:hypothetical protein
MSNSDPTPIEPDEVTVFPQRYTAAPDPDLPAMIELRMWHDLAPEDVDAGKPDHELVALTPERAVELIAVVSDALAKVVRS